MLFLLPVTKVTKMMLVLLLELFAINVKKLAQLDRAYGAII